VDNDALDVKTYRILYHYLDLAEINLRLSRYFWDVTHCIVDSKFTFV